MIIVAAGVGIVLILLVAILVCRSRGKAGMAVQKAAPFNVVTLTRDATPEVAAQEHEDPTLGIHLYEVEHEEKEDTGIAGPSSNTARSSRHSLTARRV